jgi:hypothetical protein
VEIKKKYDPKNVLRPSQNIKPDRPSIGMENELPGAAGEIPGLGAAHNAGPRAHCISG